VKCFPQLGPTLAEGPDHNHPIKILPVPTASWLEMSKQTDTSKAHRATLMTYFSDKSNPNLTNSTETKSMVFLFFISKNHLFILLGSLYTACSEVLRLGTGLAGGPSFWGQPHEPTSMRLNCCACARAMVRRLPLHPRSFGQALDSNPAPMSLELARMKSSNKTGGSLARAPEEGALVMFSTAIFSPCFAVNSTEQHSEDEVFFHLDSRRPVTLGECT
jgi:hypothetical protein